MKGPVIVLGTRVHPRAAAVTGCSDKPHMSAIAMRLALAVPAHHSRQAEPFVPGVVTDLFTKIACPFSGEGLLWYFVLLHTTPPVPGAKAPGAIQDSSLNPTMAKSH